MSTTLRTSRQQTATTAVHLQRRWVDIAEPLNSLGQHCLGLQAGRTTFARAHREELRANPSMSQRILLRTICIYAVCISICFYVFFHLLFNHSFIYLYRLVSVFLKHCGDAMGFDVGSKGSKGNIDRGSFAARAEQRLPASY